VDLGAEPEGFVDVLHLPEDPSRWPLVGREGLFEVLQHRPGQVRLFPLDAGMRSKRYRVSNWSGDEWVTITQRYPIGSMILGTVTDIVPGDREYAVRFEDFWSFVEYDNGHPTVGTVGSYTIMRHLESTRRIIIHPSP
jgi:hypothetical protein